MKIWKTISDHPNYEVSNYGEIRNKKTGRILKQYTNERGYLILQIDRKSERVHRLVANAFCKNKFDDSDVNHIDGNKKNNSASNLEFCTRSENIRHAFKNGLSKSNLNANARQRGTEIMKQKYSKPVLIVETGEVYSSIKECARLTGLCGTEISKCCRGLSSQYCGFHFKFL